MHVDPQCAGLDFRNKAHSLAQVVGPQAGAEPIRRRVHQLKQFFFGVVRQEGRHRAESFLIEQGIAGGLGKNHCRLDEASWAISDAPTVDDLATLCASRGEQFCKFQLVRLVGYWAELSGFV
ncbi:hypothetical protein D3C76_567230 [compost metagenome]